MCHWDFKAHNNNYFAKNLAKKECKLLEQESILVII